MYFRFKLDWYLGLVRLGTRHNQSVQFVQIVPMVAHPSRELCIKSVEGRMLIQTYGRRWINNMHGDKVLYKWLSLASTSNKQFLYNL